MILVIEEKSVRRFEWSWCPFVCFKGYWNHILRLCTPSTCHFLKLMSHALRLAISLSLCRISSLVFCAPTPSAPVPLYRLLSVFCFWYHMYLSCMSGSKNFICIYSGIWLSAWFTQVWPGKKQFALGRLYQCAYCWFQSWYICLNVAGIFVHLYISNCEENLTYIDEK